MSKLYVVGIGPGKKEMLTFEAMAALEKCKVIYGYTVYVELVKEYLPDKEYVATAMMREEERCIMAVERAAMGIDAAMVCSGDAGVYGMASLCIELAGRIRSEGKAAPEIEVVAGITAALSGAAVLGAPIGHDFAVISLSDLLTPWEKIELRLKCVAMADMACVIYNPSSKKRKDYLAKACQIMLEYKSKDTVCGYVKNIGRPGQEYKLLTLEALKAEELDMFTTVFVGNSMTKIVDGKMVTPRGYHI